MRATTARVSGQGSASSRLVRETALKLHAAMVLALLLTACSAPPVEEQVAAAREGLTVVSEGPDKIRIEAPASTLARTLDRRVIEAFLERVQGEVEKSGAAGFRFEQLGERKTTSRASFDGVVKNSTLVDRELLAVVALHRTEPLPKGFFRATDIYTAVQHYTISHQNRIMRDALATRLKRKGTE